MTYILNTQREFTALAAFLTLPIALNGQNPRHNNDITSFSNASSVAYHAAVSGGSQNGLDNGALYHKAVRKSTARPSRTRRPPASPVMTSEHQATLHHFASFRVPTDDSYSETIRDARRTGDALPGAPSARYDAEPRFNKDGVTLDASFIYERVKLGGAPYGVDPEAHWKAMMEMMYVESAGFNPNARPYVYKTVYEQKWNDRKHRFVKKKKRVRIWNSRKHDYETLSSAEGLGQFLKGTRKSLEKRVGVPYPTGRAARTTAGIDAMVDYINLFYADNMQYAQERHFNLVDRGRASPIGRVFMTQHGRGRSKSYEAHVVTLQSMGWAMWAGPGVFTKYVQPQRFVAGYPVSPSHAGQHLFASYLGFQTHDNEQGILQRVNNHVNANGYRIRTANIAQSNWKQSIRPAARVKYNDHQMPIEPEIPLDDPQDNVRTLSSQMVASLTQLPPAPKPKPKSPVRSAKTLNTPVVDTPEIPLDEPQPDQRIAAAQPDSPKPQPKSTRVLQRQTVAYQDNNKTILSAHLDKQSVPHQPDQQADNLRMQADYRRNRSDMQWVSTNTVGAQLNYVMV